MACSPPDSWAGLVLPSCGDLAECGALPPSCSLTGSQRLTSAVFADYARSLKSLGFKQGAVLFASKAGAAGRELLDELEPPRQELAEE